ncbi:hypothetical protein, partial [uncultured Akkermansia sp.]|uniref:hypothetical protein n=1 Tax=uncultured Akkermansia sp. TaxID=512294 RepID=UPI002620304D
MFSVFLFGGAGAHADILFLLDHADDFQHEFKLGVGNGGLAFSPASASSPGVLSLGSSGCPGSVSSPSGSSAA